MKNLKMKTIFPVKKAKTNLVLARSITVDKLNTNYLIIPSLTKLAPLLIALTW